MITGQVEGVYQRGKAYNIKVNGTFYGFGFKAPAFSEGAMVEFDTEQNGNFVNVKQGSLTVVPQSSKAPEVKKPAPVEVRQNVKSKDDYWSAREARDVDVQKVIQHQSSRNSAIAILAPALAAGLVKLPKAENKKLDALLALVDSVTARYDKDARSIMEGKELEVATVEKEEGETNDSDD